MNAISARIRQSTARLPCIRVHSAAAFAVDPTAHPPPGIIIALSGLDSAQRAIRCCSMRPAGAVGQSGEDPVTPRKSVTSLGSEAEGEQPPPKASLPSAAYRPGPVTLGVAIYGLLYMVWERAGWGSDTLRNVVSNVAFMPLNLTVAALLGRASRNHTLADGYPPDPGAPGAGLGVRLLRQRGLDLLRHRPQRQSAGLLGRRVLSQRQPADPRGARRRADLAADPARALEVCARRRRGADRRRRGDLVFLGPPHPRRRDRQRRRYAGGVRLPAGEPAGDPRHHHGDAPRPARPQPARAQL